MTEEQFRRWATFAIRMAHRGWPHIPRKSRKLVARAVKEVLREVRHDYPLSDVGDWDGYYRDEDGRLVDKKCIVGDAVQTTEEGFNPYYWEDGKSYRGRSSRNERWYDTYWVRVNCCLRAGLDLAVSPSAGVLGFEICDLRRMYRGNIPTWINDGRWVNQKGEQDIPDLNVGKCEVGIWL
jgi:hypothetical protein